MAQLTWQQFIKLPGISLLPLHEQKRKFIWENQQRFDRDLFTLNTAVGGVSGATSSGTSGAGIDGPLNGATVTAAGISVTTNALGQFTFPIELTDQDLVIISGGVDSITGLEFKGELRGYISGSENIISPITTLAAIAVEDGVYDKYTDAVDYVINSLMPTFGFTTTAASRTEMLTKDFIGESLTDSDDAMTAQAFCAYIDSAAEAAAAVLRGKTTTSYGELATTTDAKLAMYKYIVNNEDASVDTFASAEVESYDEILAAGAQLVDIANSEVYTFITSIKNDQRFDSNYRTTSIQAAVRGTKNSIVQTINDVLDGKIEINTVDVSTETIQSIIETEKDSLSKIELDRDNVKQPTISNNKTLNESSYSKITMKTRDGEGKPLELLDLKVPMSYYGDITATGTKLYVATDNSVLALNEYVGDEKTAVWTMLTEKNTDPVGASITVFDWPNEVASVGYDGVIRNIQTPKYLPSGQVANLAYQFTTEMALYASTAPSSSSSYQSIGPFPAVTESTSTRTSLVNNFRIVTIADDIITSDKENYETYVQNLNQYFLVFEEGERGNLKHDVLFASSYLTNLWSPVSKTVITGSFGVTWSSTKPKQPTK